MTLLGIIGGQEIIIILIIILLLFGGKKVPELMHGLGKGVKEFNKAKNEADDMLKIDDKPQSAATSKPAENQSDETKA